MVRTKSFHDTVRDRIKRDPEFMEYLLREGVSYGLEEAKVMLGVGDYAPVKRKPVLIAVEGLDGSGKTTLCRRIVQYLHDMDYQARMVSAISDNCTEFGGMVGRLVKDFDLDLLNDVECALMIAARVDCEQRLIEPLLESGFTVVSDRYHSSLFCYQRDRHGNLIDRDLALQRLEAFGLDRKPDLYFILDIDPRYPHHPMDGSNRLEQRPIEEWIEMRDAFMRELDFYPMPVVINASQKERDVWQEAKRHVDILINDPSRYGGGM